MLAELGAVGARGWSAVRAPGWRACNIEATSAQNLIVGNTFPGKQALVRAHPALEYELLLQSRKKLKQLVNMRASTSVKRFQEGWASQLGRTQFDVSDTGRASTYGT